jgi:hypothetical protein
MAVVSVMYKLCRLSMGRVVGLREAEGGGGGDGGVRGTVTWGRPFIPDAAVVT